MLIKRKILYLIISSLVVAVLGHLFFLREWLLDRYMVGPNDGLQQMVTFKKILYEQYKSGNYFYSYQFGLGGGTYSQLAFYFSTSFLFILSAIFIFVLQALDVIGPADTLFWANASIFISIVRLTSIIVITSIVFHYMKSDWLPAFTGACFYGLATIYFRHVTYWEFFADAMIWIPLLVFGVEKVFREKRPNWLIFAIAVTLINNFYFAYVNLIFIILYIIFRWFIPLAENESDKGKYAKLFICSGFLGFGISAVAFIPAVYGYLHNFRPAYQKSVSFFSWDNILFDSRYIILPTVFLLLLFSLSLFKVQTFRLYSVLSSFFIFFHFSPLVASAFNGFSAPQYRWEYLISFSIAGAISFGLEHIQRVTKRRMILSSVIVLILYLGTIIFIDDLHVFSLLSLAILLMVSITILLLFYAVFKKEKSAFYIMYVGLLLLVIIFANSFQYGLSQAGEVSKSSKNYLLSDKYNGKEQRELLQQIKNKDPDSLYRIDWKVDRLNNTPIVQDFNGISVYGSILNERLIDLYLNDLNIDTGRESVSRYATFGNRAHLYSLFQGKYMIREKESEEGVPYGFSKILESKNYIVLENNNVLPFIRTTKNFFSEKDVEQVSDLSKEYAMLEGVIIPNTKQTNAEIAQDANLIDQTKIMMVGASYTNNVLTVTEENGGLDIETDSLTSAAKDLYVHFHLENTAVDQGFTLKVNDYKTARKSNQSIYKTYDDELTIRVDNSNKIRIRLPKGKYILRDLELYQTDYARLEYQKNKVSNNSTLKWKDNRISITFNNDRNDYFMMLPIPFEKGWQVKVNNKKQKIEKVNYAFIGFPIDKDENEIELLYYPPYFILSIVLSSFSLLLSILICRRNQ
ncbi:YfhO family protein [Paraliobacillus sp. X-1268]|uniref:YfhO family protein n=1 Tax=Paraliobacillus sp. X-1268 TaxID=2213193 RepID=UPI000E3CD2B5|nr:YfhO family protein [Paraliobacillus sp. X-1268]